MVKFQGGPYLLLVTVYFISREMIFDGCRMSRLEQVNISWRCTPVMITGCRIPHPTD